jgi:hypothetical protein
VHRQVRRRAGGEGSWSGVEGRVQRGRGQKNLSKRRTREGEGAVARAEAGCGGGGNCCGIIEQVKLAVKKTPKKNTVHHLELWSATRSSDLRGGGRRLLL